MAKRQKRVAEKPVYEPTEEELAALNRILDRKSTIRFKAADGASSLVLDHPEPTLGHALLAEALGISDPDLLSGTLTHLKSLSPHGNGPDADALNFALSLIKGMKPRDELEAMLAAQMAAVHLATMSLAGSLFRAQSIPQRDSAERALNKLARTFATQLEALKRYRTGGEQKVVVQHVSVSDGSQAIVGNVTTQVSREKSSEKPALPALIDAQTVPIETRRRARKPVK
jgi:hypothetical protein